MTKKENRAGMPTLNIAEALDVGLENIGKMRKGIDRLIPMLQGMLRKIRPVPKCPITVFTDTDFPNVEWRYTTSGHEFIMYGDAEGNTFFDSRWIDYTEVEAIYRSLPVLVNGLLKEFPELKTEYAPFISASMVQFPERD